MNLQKELLSFMEYLRAHALPGFKAYTTDMYSDGYDTMSNELEYIGKEMRKSVDRNDTEHFELMKQAYEDQFVMINRQMIITKHSDLKDKHLNEGMENLDAELLAVTDLWKEYRSLYWLPACVQMTGNNGETVYLTGHERNAPKGALYVTMKEVGEIKSKGIDPWKFVKSREAYEASAISS